jgi:hypothetical protein
MGWNAGGFGSMKFPSAAALSAWKKSTFRHDAWSDWPDDLAGARDADLAVGKLLKGRPREEVREVHFEGTGVRLTWDTGEDTFRDSAGEVAALMRSGAAHGATGRFWFLGTAGAEGDFVYALTLNATTTTLEALGAAAGKKVYGSDGYREFCERVLATILPLAQVKVKPAKRSALAAQILSELGDVSDEVLAAQARRYPDLDDPRAFSDAKKVRALLASNDELRAVALWVLGKVKPRQALPLALEAADAKSPLPLRAAAMRVLGRVGGAKKPDPGADRVLALVLGFFTAPAPLALRYAALDALRDLEHPQLAAGLRTALWASTKLKSADDLFDGSPTSALVTAIGDRRLTELAPDLRKLAGTKSQPIAGREAADILAKWKRTRS